VRRFAVEVPNDDLRARRDKAFGDGESQPRRTTRHHGVAAIEIQLILCWPLRSAALRIRSPLPPVKASFLLRSAISAASNSAARVAPTESIPLPMPPGRNSWTEDHSATGVSAKSS